MMEEPQVSIRELRNRGGDVVARVQAGESLTITHAGLPVARIVPVAPPAMSAEALVAAWRRLPPVDLAELRRDIDEVLDPWLPLEADDSDASGSPA
jgi:prevent-host-death family protein